MKRLILGALLVSGCAFSQGTCTGQLQPIKPITPIGCRDTALACICGASGSNCHWSWACLNSSPAPKIPFPQPPTENAAEAFQRGMIEAERLKQLRLQNQQLQLQNQRLAQPSSAPQAGDYWPGLIPGGSPQTAGYANGNAWAGMNSLQRFAYVQGLTEGMQAAGKISSSIPPAQICALVDVFYSSPDSRIVTLVDAVGAVIDYMQTKAK
jgi:hypothetical protein